MSTTHQHLLLHVPNLPSFLSLWTSQLCDWPRLLPPLCPGPHPLWPTPNHCSGSSALLSSMILDHTGSFKAASKYAGFFLPLKIKTNKKHKNTPLDSTYLQLLLLFLPLSRIPWESSRYSRPPLSLINAASLSLPPSANAAGQGHLRPLQGSVSAFILLDLQETFDTVDHSNWNTFLSWLLGDRMPWFSSSLSDSSVITSPSNFWWYESIPGLKCHW